MESHAASVQRFLNISPRLTPRDLRPLLGTALIRLLRLQRLETPSQEDYGLLHPKIFPHRQLVPMQLPTAFDILERNCLRVPIGDV